MKRFAMILTAALIALPLTATDDIAAQKRDLADEMPAWTLELNGGASFFGRFLEQLAVTRVSPVDGLDGSFLIDNQVQREVTASTGFTLGGSVGFSPWEQATARLGFAWTTSNLEFDNDTPSRVVFIDEDAVTVPGVTLDQDDVADLNNYIISLDLLGYALNPQEYRFAPYAAAGIVGGWWNVDSGVTETVVDDVALVNGIIANDETRWAWGGNGGVGLQVGISDAWGARVEVNTYSLENPFDDDDGYGVASRNFVTTDEPSRVNMTRLTLGVTYSFGEAEPLLGVR